MTAFFDTQVLIYAVRSANPKDSKDLKSMCSAARCLIEKQQEVIVSAISVLEVMRGDKGDQTRFAQLFERKMIVKPVTANVAMRAVELLKARNKAEKVCPRCLSATNGRECKGCKLMISQHQRVNDSLITATAELTKGVDILYSEDNGILSFVPYVDRITIRKPSQDWGPLYNAITEQATAQAVEKPRPSSVVASSEPNCDTSANVTEFLASGSSDEMP